MPLEKGKSQAVISKNIRTEVAAGKPQTMHTAGDKVFSKKEDAPDGEDIHNETEDAVMSYVTTAMTLSEINEKNRSYWERSGAAAMDSTPEQREQRKMDNPNKYPGNSGTGGGYEHPKATQAIERMNKQQQKKGLRQTNPGEERGIQK